MILLYPHFRLTKPNETLPHEVWRGQGSSLNTEMIHDRATMPAQLFGPPFQCSSLLNVLCFQITGMFIFGGILFAYLVTLVTISRCQRTYQTPRRHHTHQTYQHHQTPKTPQTPQPAAVNVLYAPALNIHIENPNTSCTFVPQKHLAKTE